MGAESPRSGSGIKMKMGWALLALFTAGAAAGCSIPQRKAKTVDHGDLDFDTEETTPKHKPGIVTLPGELRSVYIAGNRSEAILRYCAEPAPDIAAQAALKVATSLEGALNSEASRSSSSGADDTAASTSLSGKGGGNAKVTNNVEHTVTVLELAGRSQAVLLTRELAYRVCELNLNGAITAAQAHTLLGTVVDVSTQLAAADKTAADAKKVAADAQKTAADAKLKAAQAELVKAKTASLGPGVKQAVESFSKACVKAHTDCSTKAAAAANKDEAQKVCDTDLATCVEDTKKLLLEGVY